tara:strand:+ start:267455 stop:267964 length:510 start_codon:yes stop_codon:yes gene_type:complete
MIFSMTGCSSIHNSIGPDKMLSDLRAQTEVPLDVASGETPICVVKEVAPSPQKQIVRIPAPYNAKLYFLLDKTVFSPESEKESKEVYQTLLKRNDSEIIISGHTDTSASNEYNDALSQRRAEKVKQDLIDLGIAEDVIHISSEGENRLLVSTPDGTVEVLNRRVEINVR